MNKKLIGGLVGLVVLGVSTAASAHVDLAVGVGVPVTVPPVPVYAAPVPVYGPPATPAYVEPSPYAVGYWRGDGWRGDGWRGDGWRGDGWREREWRRHEWREHEWREHEWRERHGW